MRISVTVPACFLFASALLLNHASAQTPEVVFLGTDPATLYSTPIPQAAIASFALDAVGNQYYADAQNGTVVEVEAAGGSTTIASRLNDATLAVDYRGNVFIADTGNKRVLELSATKHIPTVLATGVAGLHAIAVDQQDNVFYLSGNSLVEVPSGGTPATVASVPGGQLLAFGPAVSGASQLYIVSSPAAGTYNATLYSYTATGTGSYSSTPLVGFLPAITGGTITGFVVDPHSNAVIANVLNGNTQIILGRNSMGTPSDFEQTIYTSAIATTPLTIDDHGSLYFLDSAGVENIQLGPVNFGTVFNIDPNPPELALNFGAASGLTYVSSYPTGSFDAPDFDASPIYEQTPPLVALVPEATDTGILNGGLTLTDQNGATLSVPLYAFGTTPELAYYLPAQNVTRETTSNARPVAVVQTANCGKKGGISCGKAYVLDAASSTFTYQGRTITGLKNARSVAVDHAGNVYIAQTGVAGLLRSSVDGSVTHIAGDVASPIAVATDGPGNVYMSDGDSIVRVAPDGTESSFVTPATDGGYKSVLSLSIDYQDNLYAGFAVSPNNSARGGIIKITPSGQVTGVGSDVIKPLALAANHGQVLFFTDGARGTVAVLDDEKHEKVLAFGFKDPIGLTTDQHGTVTVADDALGQTVTVSSGNTGYDYTFNFNFGKVPVSSTGKPIDLTIVSVGGEDAGGTLIPTNPGPNPNFQPEQQEDYGGHGITTLEFSFTPVTQGALSTQLIGYDDSDGLNHDGYYDGKTFNLSGTGVAASGPSIAITAPSSAVTGQPLTLPIQFLNADSSVDTSFNGKVSVAYTGPLYTGQTQLTGTLSATLKQGVGNLNFTPLAAGAFLLTASNGSVSSDTVLTVGEATSSVIVSSTAFVGTSKGPEITVIATVKPEYTGKPTGFLIFYLDGAFLGSVQTTTGSAKYTSKPISGLSAGSHTLEVDYDSQYADYFQDSSATVTIDYSPSS